MPAVPTPAPARTSRSPLRAIHRAWLRLLLRVLPAERQRLFVLTLAVGALGGLAAVTFHLALDVAQRELIGRAFLVPGWGGLLLLLGLPAAGGIVCGVLLQYFVPDARGSGIPQVKVAYEIRGGRIPLRVAVGKLALSTLQIGSGASLGREGPTVQICAGLGSALGRLFALSRRSMRRLVPVGAAAGIAAAFNAPIAAVTFVLEEIVGDIDQAVLGGVVVAAALAATIERVVLGTHPALEALGNYGSQGAASMLLYAALGVAAAGASLAFQDALLGVRKMFQRPGGVPPWALPAVGGVMTGALAALAWFGLGAQGVAGVGYGSLSLALQGRLALEVLAALCVLKLVATAFSYGSGGAGGLFAPALFVGGMLGGVLGHADVGLLHHASSQVGAFALVGMGAVLAGAVRAPITSVLIIFEMTGNYGLILPLMIANTIAYGLARRWRPTPIYDALIEQDGIQLPGRRDRLVATVGRLQVGSAMTADPVTLDGGATLEEALAVAERAGFGAYPVVEEGRFVGMAGEARLRRAAARGEGERKVADLAVSGDCVYADEPLLHATVRMDRRGVRQLGVVAREGPRRLLGVVTMGDVVRAQARAAMEADPTVAPEFGEAREVLEG